MSLLSRLFGRPTPITQRRLNRFQHNRRAVWSLRLFLGLTMITLCGEFIANERPLFVRYDGESYFPIVKMYSETQFGGFFETEANYHDPFVQGLIAEKGWLIFPLIPFSYDTIDRAPDASAPAKPSPRHWLGTDDVGRDVCARLIFGFRISIVFGMILTLLSAIIGVTAGAVQGYFGGKVDLYFQRFIEIWVGLPVLFLLIIMGSIVRPNFWWLLGVMLLFKWMIFVPFVRAEFLRGRNFEYVKAAHAMGIPTFTVMARHILPNAIVATLTYLPFIMNAAIGLLTSLDFLGFGLPPGSPSLGEMLAQGKNNLHAPWLGITAFCSVSFLLSLLVFVGEGVRDAFDPRKQEAGQ